MSHKLKVRSETRLCELIRYWSAIFDSFLLLLEMACLVWKCIPFCYKNCFNFHFPYDGQSGSRQRMAIWIIFWWSNTPYFSSLEADTGQCCVVAEAGSQGFNYWTTGPRHGKHSPSSQHNSCLLILFPFYTKFGQPMTKTSLSQGTLIQFIRTEKTKVLVK